MTGPDIEHRDEQQYVGIRTSATIREWPRVNALLGEVLGWLQERGVPPAGPPFYRYRTIGDETVPFDVEACVPVVNAPDTSSPIRAGTVPEASYVRMVHHGHPDRLEQAHDAIRSWAEREGVLLKKEDVDGVEVWAGLFEVYLTDPAEQADLNEWQTEVLYQMA